MNSCNKILFLSFIIIFCSCNRPENEEILGIWVISDYSVNGFDCTHLVNEPHLQWLELLNQHEFRSGSIKIENEGVWKYNPNTGTIQLSSEMGLEGWGNSYWNVTANSKNMLFKGVQEEGLINILFERKSSLPVAKRFVATEKDKIVGLWEVDSLLHNRQNSLGNGKWFRISRSGNFTSGDQTGELFTGSFVFNDSAREIHISNSQQINIQNWKVDYDSVHLKMSLRNMDSDSELFLSRIQEFGR